MSYCSNCGSKLKEGAKFCSVCGEPCDDENIDNEQDNQSEERKQRYAGDVIKCPYCGAEISSFVAICPVCGNEINSSEVSESLREFIDKLVDLDLLIETSDKPAKKGWSTWDRGQRIFWIAINIFTYCIPLIIYLLIPFIYANTKRSLTSEERKKAEFIQNYAFPNDRESILEALLFIKSKMNFLLDDKYDKRAAFWGKLWSTKADQLYNKAEILFKNDSIANDTYADIQNMYKELKKVSHIRIGVITALLVVIIAFMGIRNGKLFVSNNNSSSPSISSSTTTNEDTGIYTYSVKNYVGRNLASIGEASDDYLIDTYGAGEVRLILVSNEGYYIDPTDNDQLKEYVVVAQSISSDENITVVHFKYSDGDPMPYSVDYMSQEEIVLFVKKIDDDDVDETAYNITSINSSPDRRTYYIRDYIGRNLASFGTISESKRIDEYGAGELVISLKTEDGSYISYDDNSVLSQYIVVNQSIAANTKLSLVFNTYSDGEEMPYSVLSQNYEEITLTVQKLEGAENYIAKKKATNNNLTIENFTFKLSSVWEEDDDYDYKRYYASTGLNVAMLDIDYPIDTEDTVTLELLYNDNENMIAVIEENFPSGEVTNYEYYESDYGVSGILYYYNFKYKLGPISLYSMTGYTFCFPSPDDNRWFYLTYVATSSIADDYVDDYMDLIASISEK